MIPRSQSKTLPVTPDISCREWAELWWREWWLELRLVWWLRDCSEYSRALVLWSPTGVVWESVPKSELLCETVSVFTPDWSKWCVPLLVVALLSSALGELAQAAAFTATLWNASSRLCCKWKISCCTTRASAHPAPLPNRRVATSGTVSTMNPRLRRNVARRAKAVVFPYSTKNREVKQQRTTHTHTYIYTLSFFLSFFSSLSLSLSHSPFLPFFFFFSLSPPFFLSNSLISWSYRARSTSEYKPVDKGFFRRAIQGRHATRGI